MLNRIKAGWRRLTNLPFARIFCCILLVYVMITNLMLNYYKTKATESEAQLNIMRRIGESKTK